MVRTTSVALLVLTLSAPPGMAQPPGGEGGGVYSIQCASEMCDAYLFKIVSQYPKGDEYPEWHAYETWAQLGENEPWRNIGWQWVAEDLDPDNPYEILSSYHYTWTELPNQPCNMQAKVEWEDPSTGEAQSSWTSVATFRPWNIVIKLSLSRWRPEAILLSG